MCKEISVFGSLVEEKLIEKKLLENDNESFKERRILLVLKERIMEKKGCGHYL